MAAITWSGGDPPLAGDHVPHLDVEPVARRINNAFARATSLLRNDGSASSPVAVLGIQPAGRSAEGPSCAAAPFTSSMVAANVERTTVRDIVRRCFTPRGFAIARPA